MQSPIIKTGRVRTTVEFLGKFKNQTVDNSNLRTTSKNLGTATTQIFKAMNRPLVKLEELRNGDCLNLKNF